MVPLRVVLGVRRRLGSLLGNRLAPGGSQKWLGRPEKQFGDNFGAIWGAKKLTRPCEPGSAGPEPDRRGGVGEG